MNTLLIDRAILNRLPLDRARWLAQVEDKTEDQYVEFMCHLSIIERLNDGWLYFLAVVRTQTFGERHRYVWLMDIHNPHIGYDCHPVDPEATCNQIIDAAYDHRTNHTLVYEGQDLWTPL